MAFAWRREDGKLRPQALNLRLTPFVASLPPIYIVLGFSGIEPCRWRYIISSSFYKEDPLAGSVLLVKLPSFWQFLRLDIIIKSACLKKVMKTKQKWSRLCQNQLTWSQTRRLKLSNTNWVDSLDWGRSESESDLCKHSAWVTKKCKGSPLILHFTPNFCIKKVVSCTHVTISETCSQQN